MILFERKRQYFIFGDHFVANDMSIRVLWLFCTMLTAVRGQFDDCGRSRAAYVNLSLGDENDVPMDFVQGVASQICPVTSRTCCPLEVEESIDVAAFANIREKIPAYSVYLNESEDHLFPNYDYVTDVVIPAIRRYFELSVPPDADSIRRTLNRVTRQLDNIQLRNGGSFNGRMIELFADTYLERMRGLYDFGPDGDYSNAFIGCAEDIIEGQISDEVTSAINVIDNHFRSLYYIRELFFSIHIVFFHLEGNLPFASCLRSFAELFYCQICAPETATLFPCRNVCKNVLSGCTIFLHVTGEELINPLRALCQLNTMTSHASWNLHTALNTINNNLYSIFDTSVGDLVQIASSISSCNEAPALATVPTPTDNPNRTTAGRQEILSSIPTSLTSSLYYNLVVNQSTVFQDFENITEKILENECGGFPESDGSSEFECWHRTVSSTTDVDYLGINFEAAVNNGDLSPPPSTSFINDFNTSIDFMRSNTTEVMEFVDAIPDDMRVNVDNCNSLVFTLPTLPTTLPTTSTTATTTILLPTATNTDPDFNGSKRTGFNTVLLLLSAIMLLILIH